MSEELKPCAQCGACGVFRNRRAAPAWSSDPPTEPGWYVACCPEESPFMAEVEMRPSITGGKKPQLVISTVVWTQQLSVFVSEWPGTRWLKIEPPTE